MVTRRLPILAITAAIVALGADSVKTPELTREETNRPNLDKANEFAVSSPEVAELKQMLLRQQMQIDELRRMLLEKQSNGGLQSDVKALDQGANAGRVTAATPAVLLPAITTPESSPLSVRIGSAYITPVGFVDLTSVYRDTNAGTGIGTNFGSIPYRNASSVSGNLGEFRLSTQNSRIGARVDAIVKGSKVLGYWESDFLGPFPTNASVNSNSDSFRLRLYWVDLRKHKLELLGGQSWSMLTPGRKGISPLPSDLFYSQVVDVNYMNGLTWSRTPQFRVVYHPSDSMAMGVSVESAEQYIGGSGGGGTIMLPSNLAEAYTGELDNGRTGLTVPNVHPDIIAKLAFDPKLRNNRDFHFEIGGIERTFKTYDPLTARHFTKIGAGIQANVSWELLNGLRVVSNNYWSDGGGRYLFGVAPDLVVRGDGSLSTIHSGSTVSGFELTRRDTQFYAYYGGIYIDRNTVLDPASGKYAGYGFPGSDNSHDRSIQEGTAGFARTFWNDARYGALALLGQYAYFTRNPWSPTAGANATHMNEVFLNLRYSLPGSPPALFR